MRFKVFVLDASDEDQVTKLAVLLCSGWHIKRVDATRPGGGGSTYLGRLVYILEKVTD